MNIDLQYVLFVRTNIILQEKILGFDRIRPTKTKYEQVVNYGKNAKTAFSTKPLVALPLI